MDFSNSRARFPGPVVLLKMWLIVHRTTSLAIIFFGVMICASARISAALQWLCTQKA
jgi:hypothetical protein